MAPDAPHALMIGGGIAGLASAIALGNRGWRCTVLERDPGRRRRGQGLLLPPSGREALRTLGVTGIEASGTAIERFDLCHRDGRTEARFAIGGALGLLHRDLVALLERALPPTTTVVGCRCSALETDADGQVRAVASEDGRHWRGDLIVGADGVRSSCRQRLFPEARLTPTLTTELVLAIEAPDLARRLGSTCRKYQDPQAGLALGLLPSGRGHLVLFAQFDTSRHAPSAETTARELLRHHFGGWNPLLDRVLADLEPTNAHLWHTTDLDPLPRLHHGNLVLVGDSGHPLLTITSQGVASALADALELQAVLDGLTPRDPEALRAALERYSSSRLPVLRELVREGRAKRQQFLRPDGAGAVLSAPLVGYDHCEAEPA